MVRRHFSIVAERDCGIIRVVFNAIVGDTVIVDDAKALILVPVRSGKMTSALGMSL